MTSHTSDLLISTADGMPPLSDFTWRIERLTQAMADEGLDDLVAYGWSWRPDNVRYLTGAPTTGMSLVRLAGNGKVRALVSSEADRAAILRAGWVEDVTRVDEFSGLHVQHLLDGIAPGSRVGITHLELMPVGLHEVINGACPGLRLAPATRFIDVVKLQKSEWERDQFVRGARVAQDGWESMLAALAPGVREFEVVAAVERQIKHAGAEDNFMLIAFGKDEVRGMHTPELREMNRGDLVRTEMTPQVNGYYTQICRTAVLGEATLAQQRTYEAFYEALEAGIATVRPGVTSHDVAKAQNDVLRRHGFGEYCTPQHTRVRGHGLGMHPDEVPGLQEGDETVIPEGATLVVHPNTFSHTAGYMVIGDPVIVTHAGAERLAVADAVLPNRRVATS